MKNHLAILFIVLAVPCSAQFIGGNSLSIIAPSGDFAETHTVAIGFYGNVEYQLSKLAFVGEVGWANWSADEESDAENFDTWSITVGMKYAILGPLYLEGRTGYYFKELNEVVFIPALGLRLGKFDINMGANVLNPKPFLNLRLGFFWVDQSQ